MKKPLIPLLFALTLLFFSGSYGHAQSRVGHINVQALVNEMPQTKAAQAEIERLEQTYRADLEASAKELQNLYTKYQNEAASHTQEENEKRAKEVQEIELNIRQTEQMAGKELQEKQMELLEPIFKMANDAIQRVARAQGLNYVLDSGAGQGVIFADGTDLMDDVKRELGF